MTNENDDKRAHRSRRELALNIGAVLGLICIVGAIASMLLGVTPLVFRSGSMAPNIPTGSLALARSVDASDIRIGDVVSVDNSSGTRISHRVIAISPISNDAVSLTLKGDANRIADPEQYIVTSADRIITHVPLIGYAAAWLSSKTVIFVGGIIAGALLMLAFGPARRPNTIASDDALQTEPSAEPANDSEAELQEAHRG